MPLPYSKTDIREKFDTGAIRRGNDCYLNGKVISVNYVAASLLVSGVIRGSAGERYDVWVQIQPRGGHINFQAACTCPVNKL